MKPLAISLFAAGLALTGLTGCDLSVANHEQQIQNSIAAIAATGEGYVRTEASERIVVVKDESQRPRNYENEYVEEYYVEDYYGGDYYVEDYYE